MWEEKKKRTKERKRRKGFWKVALFFLSFSSVCFLIVVCLRRWFWYKFGRVFCILRIRAVSSSSNFEFGFESLPHPPYSPDLVRSDYYMFLNLKRWLCGRCFESNEEVEWETEGYFWGFDKSYYLKGIEKTKDLWIRCIELKEEYIEKYNRVWLKKMNSSFHHVNIKHPSNFVMR